LSRSSQMNSILGCPIPHMLASRLNRRRDGLPIVHRLDPGSADRSNGRHHCSKSSKKSLNWSCSRNWKTPATGDRSNDHRRRTNHRRNYWSSNCLRNWKTSANHYLRAGRNSRPNHPSNHSSLNCWMSWNCDYSRSWKNCWSLSCSQIAGAPRRHAVRKHRVRSIARSFESGPDCGQARGSPKRFLPRRSFRRLWPRASVLAFSLVSPHAGCRHAGLLAKVLI
jgi:hypothetical protein